MEVTLLGMDMLVNDSHPSKARSPMEVTLLGISILVNDEHQPKAQFPMEVTVYSFPSNTTVDGIVTDIASILE